MDFLDLLDIFVDPVVDLALCRGQFGMWIKKRCVSFLLAAGSIACLVRLVRAICAVSVPGIVVWAIGATLVTILDFRYTLWWIREGRFGADLPFLDKIPFPKADLTNTPYNALPSYDQPDEDIWKQLGVRD